MVRQGGRKVERTTSRGNDVEYQSRLSATLLDHPQCLGDGHGLLFHVPQLAFAPTDMTDTLRHVMDGHQYSPAIVVITTNATNDTTWKNVYGSRSKATKTLVRELGIHHRGSVHVHPTTRAATVNPSGDGSLPNGRSQFALLLDRPLDEDQFHQLLEALRTGAAS